MYLLHMLLRGPVPVNGRSLNVSGRDMVERSAVPVNGVPRFARLMQPDGASGRSSWHCAWQSCRVDREAKPCDTRSTRARSVVWNDYKPYRLRTSSQRQSNQRSDTCVQAEDTCKRRAIDNKMIDPARMRHCCPRGCLFGRQIGAAMMTQQRSNGGFRSRTPRTRQARQ